jgi:hypothetical protein
MPLDLKKVKVITLFAGLFFARALDFAVRQIRFFQTTHVVMASASHVSVTERRTNSVP